MHKLTTRFAASSSGLRAVVVAVVLGVSALPGMAQTPSGGVGIPSAQRQGVLLLNSSATVEVAQDWMTLVFSANREGVNASLVQAQLKEAADAALAQARRVARPGQIEVQTGNFSIRPRYSAKGELNGWQGTAELVVEGRDMAGMAALSGSVQTMSIARVGYSLARETQQKAAEEVTRQAIAKFRAQASDYARQFGFNDYTLLEVQVGAEDGNGPSPRMMAMAVAPRLKAMDEAAPLPVEAGKSAVTATVSGSVQLR